MIRSLASFFTHIAKRFIPDAYLFALILTFVVFALGMGIESRSAYEMVSYWGDSFWKLIAFGMQMVVILVTGHTLAKTKVIGKGLEKIASIPKGPKSAIALVTVVAIIACWINWGFGLIIGALLSLEVAKRVKNVHYGLLVASAYSGFLVWHGGLSGSIPLKVATAKGFMAKILDGAVIPVNDTIFSTLNICIVVVLLVTLPFINSLMMPKKKEVVELDIKSITEEVEVSEVANTPAEKIENSKIISFIFFAMGSSYIVIHFFKGGSLNLNIVNLIFLFLGVLFHQTPKRFLKSFNEAIKSTGGIVLQFPLYAGIMGMMTQSGLAASMSNFFIEISNVTTFPFFTFLSAGIVNFFVPSGGGQWAVQGPIIIPAAKELGVPLAKAAIAISWGDAWTNMLQPFWALPLLSIAKLGLRDIMGFCVVTFLWSGLVTSFFLFVF